MSENNTALIEAVRFNRGSTGDIEILPPGPVATGTVYVKNDPPAPKPKPVYVTGPIRRRYAKIGRNEQCPCGSKIKYKFCHEKK